MTGVVEQHRRAIANLFDSEGRPKLQAIAIACVDWYMSPLSQYSRDRTLGNAVASYLADLGIEPGKLVP